MLRATKDTDRSSRLNNASLELKAAVDKHKTAKGFIDTRYGQGYEIISDDIFLALSDLDSYTTEFDVKDSYKLDLEGAIDGSWGDADASAEQRVAWMKRQEYEKIIEDSEKDINRLSKILKEGGIYDSLEEAGYQKWEPYTPEDPFEDLSEKEIDALINSLEK